MANAPKYMDIVNWTIEQITTGVFKHKDKFLSEEAIGKKFSCSRQTVRRALEMLEKTGHVNRIQGSGTYISSNNSYSRSKYSQNTEDSITLGLISTFMDNYIFPSFIRGINSVFSAGGFGLHMVSANNLVAGEAKALQHMLSRRLDGLIVEPTRSALPCANLDLYNSIIQRGIPLVFIDSFYPELSVPYVALDDEKAGYVATEYLLKMGHRNIMGIFPYNNRQGHLRYLGYVKAFADYGIPIQEDCICWYSSQSILPALLSNQFHHHLSTCTGGFCYNDSVALMLIDLLRQMGKKVPEDFSVIGIDNSELARFCSLTTVAHPAERLGEAAANLLLSMINGEEGKTILFQPQLIERNSTSQCGKENGNKT